MKIVFAGQLDRVFANEFAISVGLDPDEDLDLEDVDEQRSTDSYYFQMAGTLAALSGEVVPLPYVRYAADPTYQQSELEFLPSVADPKAAGQRIEAIARFDLVANEALELAKICALVGQFLIASDEILDGVDTEEAWIGHYHALRHLHGDHGVPLTYLAGLLMQALHAWETGAVIVLAECDRFILADLGAMIVRKRWPRPFAIPDLRYIGPPYNKECSGPIVNLRPADLSAVDVFKRDPGIRAYAEAIAEIVSRAEVGNVGSALEGAKRSLRLGIPSRVKGTAEITLVAASVKMFGNAGTATPGRQSNPDDWSKRRFPKRMLRTIVLA
jgi:hypothetical protein